jgi:hypothetical protein
LHWIVQEAIPRPGGGSDNAEQKYSGLIDRALHCHGLTKGRALVSENVVI